MLLSGVRKLHEHFVLGRRLRVLAERIAERVPRNASVLDIGAGSGDLASWLLQLRSDITIEGGDVLLRAETAIRVIAFDGQRLPLPDDSFDVSPLIDVLHHTDVPTSCCEKPHRSHAMA